MSCLDPRQFLLSSFYMDPTANSLLLANLAAANSTSSNSNSNLKRSDKMSSFNISQLLSSSAVSSDNRLDDDGPDSSTESDQLHTSTDDVLHLMTSSCVEDESTSSSRRDSPSESSTSPTSGAIKKARKARTIFTDKQLQELETTFEKQKYLSVQDRMELANKMGLSDTQVKTWYQNRRTKWKRQSSVGLDLLSDAGNLAAVQQLFRTNPLWATGYLSNIPPFLVGQQIPGAGSVPTPSSTASSDVVSTLPHMIPNVSISTATSNMPTLSFLLPSTGNLASSGLLTTIPPSTPTVEKSE